MIDAAASLFLPHTRPLFQSIPFLNWSMLPRANLNDPVKGHVFVYPDGFLGSLDHFFAKLQPSLACIKTRRFLKFFPFSRIVCLLVTLSRFLLLPDDSFVSFLPSSCFPIFSAGQGSMTFSSNLDSRTSFLYLIRWPFLFLFWQPVFFPSLGVF